MPDGLAEQFTLDEVLMGQVDHLDDIDQLVELLVDLLDYGVITVGDDGDP